MVWDDYYTAAAFSPDGRYVAEAVYDNIRLWDTQTGEMVRLLDATPPIVTPADGLAFSPDGSALARNDYNHNLWVLGTADSALLADYTNVSGSYSVVYSPDGQWLATPGPSTVMLWHVSDGTSGPTGFVGSGGKAPTAVAFSPNGQTLELGAAKERMDLSTFTRVALIERSRRRRLLRSRSQPPRKPRSSRSTPPMLPLSARSSQPKPSLRVK